MAYLDTATFSATVTVATETAVGTNGANVLAVPANARVVIRGVVACAAGTGGTTAAVKVRQGNGTGGTQVGPTITSPALTANSAQVVPFEVVDTAPPANGQYTATLTFTGNTSSAVTTAMDVTVDTGILA